MKPIEYLHPQQLGRNSLMNVSSFYSPKIQNDQSPIFENPTRGLSKCHRMAVAEIGHVNAYFRRCQNVPNFPSWEILASVNVCKAPGLSLPQPFLDILKNPTVRRHQIANQNSRQWVGLSFYNSK